MASLESKTEDTEASSSTFDAAASFDDSPEESAATMEKEATRDEDEHDNMHAVELQQPHCQNDSSESKEDTKPSSSAEAPSSIQTTPKQPPKSQRKQALPPSASALTPQHSPAFTRRTIRPEFNNSGSSSSSAAVVPPPPNTREPPPQQQQRKSSNNNLSAEDTEATPRRTNRRRPEPPSSSSSDNNNNTNIIDEVVNWTDDLTEGWTEFSNTLEEHVGGPSRRALHNFFYTTEDVASGNSARKKKPTFTPSRAARAAAVEDNDDCRSNPTDTDAHDDDNDDDDDDHHHDDHADDDDHHDEDDEDPHNTSFGLSRDLPSYDELLMQEEEDRKWMERFWKTYDDVVILSLFGFLGIVARIAAANWFAKVGTTFSSDSALFTNLPLNCLSCFLMGLLGSGTELMAIINSRNIVSSNDGRSSIVQPPQYGYPDDDNADDHGGDMDEHHHCSTDMIMDEEDGSLVTSPQHTLDGSSSSSPFHNMLRRRRGQSRQQQQTPRQRQMSAAAKATDPNEWHTEHCLEAEDELREVQLQALERRIRASPCLVLFPAKKQEDDVMEHYFNYDFDETETITSPTSANAASTSTSRGSPRRRRRRQQQRPPSTGLFDLTLQVEDDNDDQEEEVSSTLSSPPARQSKEEKEERDIEAPPAVAGDESMEQTTTTTIQDETTPTENVVIDEENPAERRTNNHHVVQSDEDEQVDAVVRSSLEIETHESNIRRRMPNGPTTNNSSAIMNGEGSHHHGVSSPSSIIGNGHDVTSPHSLSLDDDFGGRRQRRQARRQFFHGMTANLNANLSRFQRINIADGWDVGTTAQAMSEDLLLGLRIGFCGALSSFTSWNSSMVNLLRNGQVGEAIVGYVIGLQLPIVAFRFGQHVAVYYFVWRRRRESRRDERRGYGIRVRQDEDEDDEDSFHDENDGSGLVVDDNGMSPPSLSGDPGSSVTRRGSSKRTSPTGGRIVHGEEATQRETPSVRAISTAIFVMAIVTQVTSLLFFTDPKQQQIAISLLFSPFGVLARWKLSKFNNWRPGFPLGTFSCNLLACALSGSLGSLLAGNPGPEESIVIVAMISGFAGSLSSVATFVVEILSGIDPIIFKFNGINYAIATIWWAFLIGFVTRASKDWADEISNNN